LLLVLDTNIYIHAFTTSKKPACKTLMTLLTTSPSKYRLRIPRMIVEEVRRNLVPEVFREFLEFISELTTFDEDIFVPFELGSKYEATGLKPADAFIAAFVEWVGADALITENRHFLTHRGDLPFKVLSAEEFLGLI